MNREQILDQLRQLGIPVDDPDVAGKSDGDLQQLLDNIKASGFSAGKKRFSKKTKFSQVFAAFSDLVDTSEATDTLPVNPTTDAASGGKGGATLTPIEDATASLDGTSKPPSATYSAPNAMGGGDPAAARAPTSKPDWMSNCRKMADACKDPGMKATLSAFADGMDEMYSSMSRRFGATEAAVTGIQKDKDASTMSAFSAAVDRAVLRGALTHREGEIRKQWAEGRAADKRTFSAGPNQGLTQIAAMEREIDALPADPRFAETFDSPVPGDPTADPWVLRAAQHIPQMRPVLKELAKQK